MSCLGFLTRRRSVDVAILKGLIFDDVREFSRPLRRGLRTCGVGANSILQKGGAIVLDDVPDL